MKIANYILAIIRSHNAIMYTWRFNRPVILVNNSGIIFQVNASKHKGFVKIIYHTEKDLFLIKLLNESKNEVRNIENVTFDRLVETIDNAVERFDEFDIKMVLN